MRFVKQAYDLKNIRVMSYTSIRNMASLVLAAAYFATVWIRRHVGHEVLTEYLTRLGRRPSLCFQGRGALQHAKNG